MQETKQLEYKEKYSKEECLKSVSAFSNEEGGSIIFGISDEGKVLGIEDTDFLRLQIENAIQDTVMPRPYFSLKEEVRENKKIVILEIMPGYDVPYYYKGKAYCRADTGSRPMDARQIQMLLSKRRPLPFEEKVSLEKKLNFQNLERRLKERLHLQNFNEDTLRTLGLMKYQNYLYSAELLADENSLSFSGIDIVRFGENENIFLDRLTLRKKSLLIQYEKALEFFDKWYAPYEEVIGFYREKRIPVPREAFREAIVNALVHRRMDVNALIHVAMYPDKIEITSPGSLPDGITKKEFLEGRLSVLRNVTIAEVFHRLGLMEAFSTGIKRMKEEYKNYVEEVQFMISESYVTVVLPKIQYQNQNKRLIKNLEKNIGNREQEILQIISSREKITRRELEEMTGLKKSVIGEKLVKLQKEKKIEKLGSGRFISYKIID
ncbi:AAA family ATPase [Fusobacterium necrophorum]|uniref:ATPase AAA n=2 Tax=Fusobacterium necrophorum TaxID=859 RepID=A0AB73BTT5_9FUSO|nr:RNA-binding domain-containing protein [Fusobacterium necrophorum]AVQ21764.1 AAA family ATPase [Fusobacterium necrophorum subsp. funduliforme]AYZ74318.1 AAA family ATPase [Fusobacterium necrophorum]AZW09796.1 AAA family ATPase [Fusobacterium necrophorum subsp. necrophorum]KDE61067.1 ATPase AAA [Fusobacterium necrophorum BL]KDE68390.1 ATPase AAA [Fusobacterium necrophorum DJ-1]